MCLHTRNDFELRPCKPVFAYRGLSGQVENELEGVFHCLHFVVGEVADVLSEGARIDGSDHLAKNLRRMIENGDLRVEAG